VDQGTVWLGSGGGGCLKEMLEEEAVGGGGVVEDLGVGADEALGFEQGVRVGG